MGGFEPVRERPGFIDESYEVFATDQVDVVLADRSDVGYNVRPVELPDGVNSFGTDVDVIAGWLRLETGERVVLVEGRHNAESVEWSTLCLIVRTRTDDGISGGQSCVDKAALGAGWHSLGTDNFSTLGNIEGGHVIVNHTQELFAYGVDGLFAIPDSNGDDIAVFDADGVELDDPF